MKRLSCLTSLLALPLVACGAGPDSLDHVSTSSEAITSGFSVSAIQYEGLVRLLNPGASTVSVSGGNAILTPSSNATSILFPSDPHPADHSISAPLPTYLAPSPGILGPYTITVTSLSLVDASSDLQPSTVHINVQMNGSLHAHSANIFQPDFDIQLTNLVADTQIALTPAGLSQQSFTVSTQSTVTGCSVFGICNSIMQSNLPNVGSAIQSALSPKIASALSSPSVLQGLEQGLATYEMTFGGAPQGSVMSGTPSLKNSAIVFSLAEPPTPPTGCAYSLSCGYNNGQVYLTGPVISFQCPASGDALQLQMLFGSTWENVGNGMDGYYGLNAVGYSSQQYRVCDVNAAGVACSASFTTPSVAGMCTASSSGGGGGGGGGGGSSGGSGGGSGKGGSCGGKPCLQ